MNKRKDFLNQMLEEYWFVPSDALLRAAEAKTWSKQSLKRPILDIGCGDGGISKFIYSHFGKIEVGIDSDYQGIKKAQKCQVYKKAICADAVKMPFANESFAAVISNSVFEHIENDLAAIAEVSRVLKPVGQFLLTVPSDHYYRMLVESGLKEKDLEKFNQRVNHYHYRGKEEWRKIFSKNGLKLIFSHEYFSKKTLKTWYFLFKIATFKIRGRELWSYCRDSRFSKFIPRKIIIFFLKKYLEKYYQGDFSGEGSWLFLIAQKQK